MMSSTMNLVKRAVIEDFKLKFQIKEMNLKLDYHNNLLIFLILT